MYTFKTLNISNLILARISKLENDASGYYQKSPSKKLTKTHVTLKILDKISQRTHEQYIQA
jgi:hypothetical protein